MFKGIKALRIKSFINPVVISKIHGGLGNQMFQYAHAMSVAKKHDLDLKLTREEIRRSFRLSEFEGFRYTWATERELVPFRSRTGRALNRPNHLLIKKHRRPIYNLYLSDYYIGERFFKEYSSSVRGCFKFPPLQSEASRRTAALIRGEPDAVAVHVRRGDYVQNEKYIGVVTPAYYKEAMEFFGSRVLKPRYFVFSDDLSYCKHLFRGKDVCFVEGCASEIEEMHLMSLCDHSILANSTFSWWGAWLGDDKKFVVFPYKWTNSERRNAELQRDGLFLDTWWPLKF